MRRTAISLIALMLVCGARASGAAKDINVDSWMSVYMGPVKVGYQHISVARDSSEGKDVYRLCEMRATAVRSQGITRRAIYTDTLILDNNLRPLHGIGEKIDDGVVTRTVARFLADRIECTQTTGSDTVTKSIPIPPGADLSLRPAYVSGQLAPTADKSIASYGLDFHKMALFHNDLHAVERKEVTFRGAKRTVLIVRYGNSEQDLTDWRLDSGEIIRTEIPKLGTILTATTREDALAEAPAQDLSRIEVDKPIADPIHARDLTLRLIGVPDKELVISDSRQNAVFDAKDRSATYRIHAAPFNPAKSSRLPIKRKALAAYLKPTKGIESSDPSIVKQARSIVGDEKSAYTAACKLVAWVHANVKQSQSVSAYPSAVAVLKERTGLCRHNAVLYAAMARSIGIPTRLASGIMYDRGAFAFHTWAESWVGEWVALDPTFPGEFVDATHIKLVQGEVDDLPAIARVMGRLRAEVVPPRQPSAY